MIERPGLRGRPLSWKNAGESECPPFGLIRPTGVEKKGRTPIITGEQPNEDGQPGLLVNGPFAVGPGKYGTCSADLPAYIAYSGATPSHGETWGAVKNDWKLGKDKPGYSIIGGENGSAVLVDRKAGGFDRIRGLTTSAVSDSATAITIDNIVVIKGDDPRDDPESSSETLVVHRTADDWEADSGAEIRAEWCEAEEQWEVYDAETKCKDE